MKLLCKIRKLVCYILICSMFFSATVLADENIDNSENILAIENMIRTAPVSSVSYDTGVAMVVYEPEYFAELLDNCKSVIEVATIGNVVSVYYETMNDQEVMLLYEEGVVFQKTIYDKKEDKLTVVLGDSIEIYDDFRSSSIYKTPQEVLKRVEKALEKEDYDELESIEGISVNNINGTMVIDYETSVLSTVKEGNQVATIEPRTVSGFVAPETQFVPYTKRVVATSYKPNSTLNKNIKISVKQSMNSYVKEEADLRSFIVGTALTVVSSYLSLPATTTVKVLTVLGVLNSAKDALSQAVTLYKSASYIYTGSKEGYAYDTTVYNKDVKAYFNSSKGKLHGAYNSSGEFTWIDYVHASALDVSNSTIIDKTSYNYNADILDDGVCTLYYPD